MLPVVRDPSRYPGQFGVSGSDVERGLRWRSAGFVLYVNNIHPLTGDGNDDTNPDAPLTTIGQACRAVANETLGATLRWAITEITENSQQTKHVIAQLGLI